MNLEDDDDQVLGVEDDASRNEKISNSGTLTRNATLLEMGNGDGQEKEARTTNTNTNIIFIYFILCSLT
jgi:hypothetical protein